jgi:hypothetical protein
MECAAVLTLLGTADESESPDGGETPAEEGHGAGLGDHSVVDLVGDNPDVVDTPGLIDAGLPAGATRVEADGGAGGGMGQSEGGNVEGGIPPATVVAAVAKASGGAVTATVYRWSRYRYSASPASGLSRSPNMTAS